MKMAVTVPETTGNVFLDVSVPSDDTLPAVGSPRSSRTAIAKLWNHDCRQHRSWRCVWCEQRFCFECDTGKSASLNRYSLHRLCEKHYAELPGQKPSAVYQLHARQFGLTRPFSIDVKYIPTHVPDMPFPKPTLEEMQCHCLMSKTLLCKKCAPQAEAWRIEEETLLNTKQSMKCAFARFPGGCRATESGQKCSCKGRGVDCNFIPEQDWKIMEAEDLQWLGMYGAMDDNFKKKEKKDLRSMFGESFPRQNVDSGTIGDDVSIRAPVKPYISKLRKRRSGQKSLVIDIQQRISRSSTYFHTLKPVLSSSSQLLPHVAQTSTPEEYSPRSATQKIQFLANPQFRKPYCNFRVSAIAPLTSTSPPEYQSFHDRSQSISESFFDLNSDDEGAQLKSDESDEQNLDHLTDNLSFISFSSSSDLYEDEKFDTNYQLGLAPPPRIIHIASATAFSRPTAPRLIHHVHSVPDLKKAVGRNRDKAFYGNKEAEFKFEVPKIEIKEAGLKEKPMLNEEVMKWGCQEEVHLGAEDLQTWEAHGFWKCSFCDGRIRGV